MDDDDGTALKGLELPEEEVTNLKQRPNLQLICSTQITMESADKPAKQEIIRQWAVQVDLGGDALNEFHSRIPRMAHRVCYVP